MVDLFLAKLVDSAKPLIEAHWYSSKANSAFNPTNLFCLFQQDNLLFICLFIASNDQESFGALILVKEIFFNFEI